ncbi:type II toxin-antitoxin system VapC family toxin [Enterobacter cloacae complex sp. 418I7]|uniref:type II toxin-antitoxin system VapC family toxin n=1 Tax=Enterobacter cloacae complex sp. 418I7 TaxID=3395839 RepID=UPI003CF2ECF7
MTAKKDDIPRLTFTGYLLDTHALIWMAWEPEKLSEEVIAILSNPRNRLYYSPASIQEIAIKLDLGKPDFGFDPVALTEGLEDAGYIELVIRSRHAYAIRDLPKDMHKDPFDRLLVAQAKEENLNLITNDEKIIKYCSDYIKIIKCC